MEYRILGPLEVAEHGSRLDVGRGKERSVLAILLLHANEVISSERLIDELWTDQPPATAAKSVQVYVSRLRKALASTGPGGSPDGVLLTRGAGYTLCVEPGQLDAESFEQGLTRAERSLAAGAPEEACETLRRVLALWRGGALADFVYEPFAELEIARLEELRLVAIEQRITADLQLGRHAAVVPELDTLVARHPLRERFWEQLMLALYRSGRQTEALQAYRRARHVLVEAAGLEPGEPLRTLELAILAHDPALAPPPATGDPKMRADDAASRPRRPPLPAFLTRHRLALLACGAAVLGVAAVAAVSQLGAGSKRDRAARPGLLAANTVGRIDPRTSAILASVAVPGGPARLALGGDELWVASDRSRTLSTVDASTRAPATTIALGSFPTDLALGRRAEWIIDGTSGRLLQISRGYGSVARRVTIDRGRAETYPSEERSMLDNPWSVAAGLAGVWVTDGSRHLVRVDPRTSRLLGGIDVGHSLNGVAVGEGAIWTISGRAATVSRIDPRTLRVTDRIQIVSRPGAEAPYPIAIRAGLGSVWVLNANVATVTRIDAAARGVTATVPIGVERGPMRLAVGGGAAWVANGDGTLSRIDAETNVATTTPIGQRLTDVVAGHGGVWVSAGRGLGAGPTAPARAPNRGDLQALPASRCSPVYYQPGERPRFVIASSLPLQGLGGEITNQMTDAIHFVLRSKHFSAGRYAVGYQACDDSTAAGSPAVTRCASNAKAYADNDSVIGVIGPYNSSCATAAIPIANRARPGPLALISPSATYLGLTRRGAGLRPGEPNLYFPTGTRSFIRVTAADDVQGAADAMLAQRLGLRRVFLLTQRPVPHEREPYGTGITSAFRRAAQKLGVAIAGSDDWTLDRSSYAGLARKIERTRADGVFLGGSTASNGGLLIKALRAGLGENVQILAPDGFAGPRLGDHTGPAGEGMTVSTPGVPPDALTGPGARFVSRFEASIGQVPEQSSVYAAQATQLLLDAIARSNGTRASVNHELFTSRVQHGILGDFAIMPSGDITGNKVTIYRLTAGKLERLTVITPAPDLISRF